jgi:hypothetical protein
MNLPTNLPLSIVAFLRTYVDSLDTLRFLLVVQCAPNGVAAIALVARLIDISKSHAHSVAGELAAHGLVRLLPNEQVEVSPIMAEDRIALADLAEWYVRDRDVIHHAMTALQRSAS